MHVLRRPLLVGLLHRNFIDGVPRRGWMFLDDVEVLLSLGRLLVSERRAVRHRANLPLDSPLLLRAQGNELLNRRRASGPIRLVGP